MHFNKIYKSINYSFYYIQVKASEKLKLVKLITYIIHSSSSNLLCTYVAQILELNVITYGITFCNIFIHNIKLTFLSILIFFLLSHNSLGLLNFVN